MQMTYFEEFFCAGSLVGVEVKATANQIDRLATRIRKHIAYEDREKERERREDRTVRQIAKKNFLYGEIIPRAGMQSTTSNKKEDPT